MAMLSSAGIQLNASKWRPMLWQRPRDSFVKRRNCKRLFVQHMILIGDGGFVHSIRCSKSEYTTRLHLGIVSVRVAIEQRSTEIRPTMPILLPPPGYIHPGRVSSHPKKFWANSYNGRFWSRQTGPPSFQFCVIYMKEFD